MWGREATREKKNGEKVASLKELSYICSGFIKERDMEGNKIDVVNEPVLAPDASYTIPRNGLLSMLSSVSVDDIPMAIKYLVDKLATIRKQETVDVSSHVWDDYKLSAEVIAMAPAKRKSIYGDYDAELIDVLEEKYK